MPDRIVRRSLTVPANLHDFLRDAAPALADGFDYTRMQSVNREMFTDDWRIREADLLFEIPFLDPALPLPALVCVLLEHQSDTDRAVPLRMLFTATGYWERCWRAWEQAPAPRAALALPPILPILLYTGDRPWGSARTLRDLLGGPAAFHPIAPGWEPVFWSLAERTPPQLLDGGAFLQVLAILRVSREEQAEFERVFADAMRRLQALHGSETVRWHDLLQFAFTYAVWRRPGGERQRLIDIAAANHPGREGEVRVMAQTIAQAYIEEGQLMGRVRQLRADVRRLLTIRFGALPDAVTQQIDSVEDLARLDGAFEQAARVQTLAEFHC
jgi:hypothetical protein